MYNVVMSQYVFILGREPALSVAEISAVLEHAKINHTWLVITSSYALFNADLSKELLNKLAGTIKVAEVLGEVEQNSEVFSDFILRELNKTEGPCYLGFSAYDIKLPWLNKTGLHLKYLIKEQGRRARLVVSREAQLSSVVVAKNKLLTASGFEFILLSRDGKLLVGRTIWVQPFEEWGMRDFGRPSRDAKSGMLPPKLARMMINLSGALLEEKLLDPFCGSGTVLQEATVLGYKNLTGSDITEQAIKDSEENFQWLKKNNPLLNPVIKILQADVFDLPNKFGIGSFDVIVTEPYLGPALSGRETKSDIIKIQKELTEFYIRVLKVFSDLLVLNGRVVMVWPSFRIGNEVIRLNLESELTKYSFKLKNILPETAPASWLMSNNILTYSRPNQHVVREIVVLEKI